MKTYFCSDASLPANNRLNERRFAGRVVSLVESSHRSTKGGKLKTVQRCAASSDALGSREASVFVTMKSEFTYENVCEPTSSPKYLAVISKFASVSSSREDIYKSLIKSYMLWRDKLEPKVRESTKKHTYAELPLRLAACFFLNGDYYKALLCLRHSIILEPRSLLPRILALRWSVFLGEWEMAEMALAFEKTKEGKAPQKEATDDYVASHLILVKGLVKCYVEFNRDHKSRSISGSTLLKTAHSVNADSRTTFLTFEAQSLANWMCSHIPKVPANFSLDNVEPLDTFNCLHRAVAKSESVVKNRIPGIHKESEPLDFMKRPPSSMCETFAMCVVRWLRKLEDVSWNRENRALKSLRERIIADALKICSYSSIRTISYRLAISHLERLQSLRRYPRYQWMADDSRTTKIVVQQNAVEKAVVDEALSEYSLYCDLLYRDWRFPLCSFLGEYASYFTLIHLALSHDGSLYLVKMHKDREPLVMPLAPKSKVESVKAMMDKIIEENTRTCNLGKTTKDAKAFWAARRAVDTDLKNIIPRVQDMLLGAAAPLLLPSITIIRKGIALAKGLVAASQSSNGAQLPLSFAKELVSLATKIERTEWVAVVERMCDILGISSRKQFIQDLYSKTKTSALNIGLGNNIPSYTFLIVCPDLTTFPWEVVPIFDGATHVARVPSVHTFFQALSSNKRVPMAVNIQKAFYVLDPDNNLGETQKRITNYVSKFGWQGIVGKIPSPAEVTMYVLVFIALCSATWVMAVVHDILADGLLVRAQLMHVRLTTLGWGMDGKSSVYDYTVAQCPSVVGCLWTVTDGEIDRYFMALVDLCFSSDANRTLTGTEDGDSRLRLLVEAMKKAKSRCKLPYLTGAAKSWKSVCTHNTQHSTLETTVVLNEDTTQLDESLCESTITAILIDERYHVCREMYTTQRNFIEKLKLLIMVKDELMDRVAKERPLLKQEEIAQVFGKVEPVMNLHERICDKLGKLTETWDENMCDMVTKIWTEVFDDLRRIYSSYSNYFDIAADKLRNACEQDPKLKEFIEHEMGVGPIGIGEPMLRNDLLNGHVKQKSLKLL
ncbi:unnamed protein product [Angiostrongylus costaricensis]|uniref:separase n=1 Tax=Angiostrongylus costaricensis TaxID=334426 RepID=A0A158PCX9_ANGCS|nr:unnamed protein product [Angiostrongylus costaricensis]